MIRNKTEVNIDIIYRVLIFSLWVILALGVLSYEYATDTVHPPALIIIATIGRVVFAIFASQRVVPWMESTGYVERHCYFGTVDMTNATRLNHNNWLWTNASGTELSELGETFFYGIP